MVATAVTVAVADVADAVAVDEESPVLPETWYVPGKAVVGL